MATTTNYGWTTPDDSALVKDGASAIRTLGSSVDTTVKALSPGTTAGDIDYYTSSTAKARLAIGSSGQVLTVSSGVPAWTTVSSGGMTLLSTTTLSGSTTTISSISGSYKRLIAFISGVQVSGSPTALWIHPNGSSTISDWCGVRNPTSASVSGAADSRITTLNNIETGGANSFCLQIDNYASTTARKPFQFYGQFLGANPPTGYSCTFAGGIKTTSAITSLQFDSNSQNFNAGTVLLYGVS